MGPGGLEAWPDELVFYDFVTRTLGPGTAQGGLMVAPLPPAAPPDVPYGPVALLGCAGARQVPVAQADPASAAGGAPAAALDGASFALVEASCAPRFVAELGAWQRSTGRQGWEIWVRR
jgi:hypothetical protein